MIKRNIHYIILGCGLMAMVSCKETKTEEETVTTNPAQTENNNSGQTTAALNPAHGQTGHRCEIPLGAPLDQAPANTLQQQQTTTTSGNVSPVRLNSSTATPLKNPPHGQPGHDCAVPVGADLNRS